MPWIASRGLSDTGELNMKHESPLSPRPSHSQGGIVQTYQKYDPQRFPSPTQPPADLVSPAFDHWLAYGSRRELTAEELARAIHLDPSQIQGLGHSIDALLALLRERKAKILATYETQTVQAEALAAWENALRTIRVPRRFRTSFQQAVRRSQLYQLERLWYAIGDDQSPFGLQLLNLMERLGERYEVEELAARYEFHGRTAMSVPQAIEIKEELRRIDELIKQLEEARETAQIGIIDLESLAEFAEPSDLQQLESLRRQVEDLLRELAQRQGLESTPEGYRLTPQAYRTFQGRLLERIFSQLQASRTGRHEGTVKGEGAVELPETKPYEFGDSLTQIDIPQTLINAMVRMTPPQLPIRIRTDDIEVHRTRNRPRCATVVIMDMSGSMRYEGQYVNVKRMALALDGLIRREYPGDYLQFIEMFTFAKQCAPGEIIELTPKPVTLFDPVVQLRADMGRQDLTESMVHPHFTNIQHSLRLARRLLATQDTPNRQVILITDGLPTAHFEDAWLYMLYPPHPRTEAATMREGMLCGARESR